MRPCSEINPMNDLFQVVYPFQMLISFFFSDTSHHSSSRPPEISLPVLSPRTSAKSLSPKSATFAMEISVEHDKRTGTSQVVSTATVSAENLQGRGSKVYDDGRKSIYALNPDGVAPSPGVDGEMTPTQVDELLRQATDENVPRDLLYHQPVYSTAYVGTSRLSGPQISNEAQELPDSQNPSPEQEQLKSHEKSLNEEEMTESSERIQAQSKIFDKTEQGLNKNHINSPKQSPVVTVKVRSEEKPKPSQLVCTDLDVTNPKHKLDSLIDSFASTNISNNQSEDPDSTPVTMIFMGYENALDEDQVDFGAELVTVGCSDDDDDEETEDINNGELVSYHPEGYTSKVFRPRVAKSCRCISDDDNVRWNHSGLHRPTFRHKSGNKGQV
ncbi:palmdelphin-like [Vanacampus margaritifer]